MGLAAQAFTDRSGLLFGDKRDQGAFGGAITGEQRHRFAVRTTVSSYPQDAPIFQTGSDTRKEAFRNECHGVGSSMRWFGGEGFWRLAGSLGCGRR